ncbi:MAG: V-type ATP synthase subunit I [Deltaproteobacteria bacterium]
MIVEMAKVRILGPRSLLPGVADLLQNSGDLHIESKPRDLPEVQSEIPVIRRHVLKGDAQRTREMLESSLDKIRKLLMVLPAASGASGPGGGTGSAASPPPGDEAPLQSLLAQLDPVATRVETILGERKMMEDELSLFSRYEKVLKVLAPLISVVRESSDLACTGLLLQARDRGAADLLEQALSRLTDDHYEILFREVDKETLAGLLVFPAEKSSEAKALLWEKNIGELRLPSSVADKPVAEALEIILRKQDEIPRRIRELDAELADISARWRGMLEESRLWLENGIEKALASDSFFETRLTFLLYGWIPLEKLERLTRSLAAAYGEAVIMERLPIGKSEEGQVPVSISNNPLIRPFEIFTRILPLPRYRTIDPTPYVALFFPLFYGIIIGDVGYGLLLLAIASLVKLRYGADRFIADVTTVFAWAALSATLWGIAYGELFGDLGGRLGLRPIFLHRMGDFTETILFALGIGVAHIILGISLGIRTALKCGERGEAVARAAGLAMVMAFIAAIAGAVGKAPPAFAYAGMAVMAASLPVMIVSAGPSSVMKFHNIVNIFSYLRIMGIGVASVALAYTANRIVTLVPWTALGILAGVTLHAVNLAFCVLSPTIQALRLHYVEFFENFFSGGGRAYKPFKFVV